jgi:hypothetical protein
VPDAVDKVSMSGAGNLLTIRFEVAFKDVFADVKNIYVHSENADGQKSGLSLVGFWRVPKVPN